MDKVPDAAVAVIYCMEAAVDVVKAVESVSGGFHRFPLTGIEGV
ncbi:MAG: hypothetical protein ACRC4N_02970 [Gammaproteobacteria bacterium]